MKTSDGQKASAASEEGVALELVFSWWDEQEGTRRWASVGLAPSPADPAPWERLDSRLAFGPLLGIPQRRCRRLEARSRAGFERAQESGAAGAGELPAALLSAAMSLSWALARSGALLNGEWSFSSATREEEALGARAYFEGAGLGSELVCRVIRQWAGWAAPQSALMFESDPDEIAAGAKRQEFEGALKSLIERRDLDGAAASGGPPRGALAGL